RHINLRLQPGERVALVGLNGAGKTTLVKLLSRLYDPSEGRILLDGRDLRDYDLASVRQAVGVIFQDFVRYDMRFDENIAVGEIEVFLRFAELIGGRMAILISHRFSTVRMADRIVVLQNGTITEHGTHEELVRGGGLYAELFDMQASGYR